MADTRTKPDPAPRRKFCCRSSFLILNISLIVLTIIFIILGVYFFHFKREPIDQILASNQANKSKGKSAEPLESGVEEGKMAESVRRWDTWAETNNLVSIGSIYDSCNGTTERLMIGKIIMKQDPDTLKLVTETTFNITFDKIFDEGEMHMTTDLNGMRLRTQKWNICMTDADKDDDKVRVDCPVPVGTHSYAKTKKIPGYLPKGRYTVNLWATDAEGKFFVCGGSEFNL